MATFNSRFGREIWHIYEVTRNMTYTFEKTFDIGVNDLETLGVFWELLLDFFGPNEQRLQIGPRSLNFLKDSEHITADNAGQQKLRSCGNRVFKLRAYGEPKADYDIVPDHAKLCLPAAHHLLKLRKISGGHHTLHHELVRLKNVEYVAAAVGPAR